MKLVSVLSVMAILALLSFKVIDNTQKVKDYFSVPGPINYNKTSYNLSWSSNPNTNYFKQEYIPITEKSETYNKMITIEAVVGDLILADVVNAKMAELDQRKKSDPSTNYAIIQNKQTGEYILDFVVSQETKNQSIVEWNVYHYAKLKDKSGKKGIMLFSFSKRGYGAATTSFLKTLKTERQPDINNFAAYPVPGVQIPR